MKYIPRILAIAGACILTAPLLSAAILPRTEIPLEPIEGPYSDWDSMKGKIGMPDWLYDGKFGLWSHWGPNAWFRENVPVEHTHYFTQLYNADSAAGIYHREHYGDPNKIGWKDVVGEFKPEHFDAEEWAQLYADAGSRFAGLMAMHVDNYAMWHSELTPWNVGDVGPKRDIMGELSKAFHKRNIPTIATWHSMVSWTWFHNALEYDGKNGDPYLYNEPHDKTDPLSEGLMRFWEASTREVCKKYRPSAIYFDYAFAKMPEERRESFSANYFNWCEQAEIDGTYFHKDGLTATPVTFVNRERGRPAQLQPEPWSLDTSIGRGFWYINKWRMAQTGMMNGTEITRLLIDVVSKNGVMLFNIAPDSHGRIPEDQREAVLEVGAWLKQNGEAIYNSRPWDIFGEGPVWQLSRNLNKVVNNESEYGPDDINYTQSKDGKTLYAIFMARPDSSQILTLESVTVLSEGTGIRLLGSDDPVRFKVEKDGTLKFKLPDLSNRAALTPVAIALDGFKLKANPPKADANTAIFWQASIPSDGKAAKTWRAFNQEALQGTRPWLVEKEGQWQYGSKAPYTFAPTDIRYTTNGKSLFAMCLARPKPGNTVVLQSAFVENEGHAVRLAANNQSLNYTLNDKMQVVVEIPTKLPGRECPDNAPLVIALDGFTVSRHYDLSQ